MAYDEFLAKRIRSLIQPFSKDIAEKSMFGGLSFLYKGKMSVGIVKNELCVRIIEDKHPEKLGLKGVRPMDFTGKPMKDMLFVSQDIINSDSDLHQWIDLGIEHAKSKL